MKIDLKIGDLVAEFDIDYPNKKFPLGVVLPFPATFLQTNLYNHENYEQGAIVWVRWPELGEANWCYADEVRLLSENW